MRIGSPLATLCMGCTVTAALLPALAPSAAAATATTPPPIPPATLVPSASQLPGFAHAKFTIHATTSIDFYVEEFTEDSRLQEVAESSELQRLGFEEASEEYFTAPGREGVAEAVVLNSPASAISEFTTSLRSDHASFEKRGLVQAPVPGLPGAVALGDFVGGRRGATDNVLFTSGRCFLLVADRLPHASNRAQGARAPVAAAKALAVSAKSACA